MSLFPYHVKFVFHLEISLICYETRTRASKPGVYRKLVVDIVIFGVTPRNRVDLSFRHVCAPALCADQHVQVRLVGALVSLVFMLARPIETALARCFLAGEPTREAIVERCVHMLGHPWRWLPKLVASYLETAAQRTRPTHADVVVFLENCELFQAALVKHHKRLKVVHWITEQPIMQPAAAAAHWQIPAIETARDLADWFWLEDGQLEWFADLKILTPDSASQGIKHYHCRILEKYGGGYRLIEVPKRRIKAIQRQILDSILQVIPAHPNIHGFVPGRSIKTFAAPHAGSDVVLRMDLKNFFPSFRCARVQALFRTLGFPEQVAALLGGICTTVTPRTVCRQLGDPLYSRRHLPQGAPTSPALANLCSYRIDCRLTGLAESAGARYTRYADDLAFSGDATFARRVERFSLHVAAIAREEGFEVRHRKTRIMRQGVRQHLAGLVVNRQPNIPRRDFDELKAILTNCIRLGPSTQNRAQHANFKAHLNGKVAFVETINPAKGAKLRQLFEKISW